MLLKVTCNEGGGGIDMTGCGLLVWKAVGSLWHFALFFFLLSKLSQVSMV